MSITASRATGVTTSSLPRLGCGLGISVNWPEGIAIARTLLAEDPLLVDFLQIYPGTGVLPEPAVTAIREWRMRGVPMTLHTAGLDLWSAGPPDERGMPLTRAVQALVSPAWCTQDLMVIRTSGARAGVLLGAILTEEAADACAARHSACSAVLDTTLLLENGPYQVLVGELGLGAFFARVAAQADCGLTLDLGHAVGCAALLGQGHDELLEGYPFERVIEIHVAGGRLEGSRFVDDHDAELPNESLALLAEVLPRCPNLRAVTYEVQAPSLEDVVPRLRRVRDLLAASSFPPGRA